ncbi:MAG TPA: ATP-binding protein [Gemmatimonadaceae bacterium]|nr:ATP-binding protein [Gemmatimonadaceae bacterium]
MSLHAAASLGQMGDVLEVGVLALDTDLVIRGWNRWLEVASGRSAGEVCDRPLVSVFPELTGSPVEAALRRAVSGAPVVLADSLHDSLLPLPPPPGHERFARMRQRVHIISLMNDEGLVEGAVALVQDVTERMAHESELRHAMARAEAVDAARLEFVAAMSHDFRTPLSTVIAYAEVMSHGGAGPVTSQQQEFLEQIRKGAEQLARMLDEVLAFATVDAGREPVHLEAFDAGALASDTAAVLEPQAREKGLEVTVVGPRASAPIRSDPAKVRQILLHLLGNALTYTERGQVTVETATQDGRVLFRVRDTGPGIAAPDLERVFDPFTRVRARQRDRRGTGLGLAVSRRLARLLGGDLAAESLPGRGSTFTLWLPAEPPRDSAPVDVSSRRSARE